MKNISARKTLKDTKSNNLTGFDCNVDYDPDSIKAILRKVVIKIE